MATQAPSGKHTALEIVGVVAAISAAIAAVAATIVAYFSWRTSEEGLALSRAQAEDAKVQVADAKAQAAKDRAQAAEDRAVAAISTAKIKSPDALADPNNCTYRTTRAGSG